MTRGGVVIAIVLAAGALVVVGSVVGSRRAGAKITALRAEADSFALAARTHQGASDAWQRIAAANALEVLAHRARVDTITRTRIRVDTVQLEPTGGGLTVPVAVVAKSAYDRLATSCTNLGDSCAATIAAKDSALTQAVLVGATEKARADLLDDALDNVRPQRFALGCAGGYGAVVSAGQVRAGPGAACGLTLRFR